MKMYIPEYLSNPRRKGPKKVTYRVRGSVRGVISTGHRTISGAVASALRDERQVGRLGGGAYSDAQVEREDGQPLNDEEVTELQNLYIESAGV